MRSSLAEALEVFSSLESLAAELSAASRAAAAALQAGAKLLICGNGGSACEAQHLAGELVGRYKLDRRPLPAIALNADASIMSCIGNDYCFDEIFSRPFEAHRQPGDVLIVFTTSGRSANVLRVLESARRSGTVSIAFLGRDGGPAAALADFPVIVRSPSTARVQEAHQFLLHCLMDEIEAGIATERLTIT
jgi:D-sedoheptulose 7-phosphate isomerase